jgi:hypothetical protein
MHLGKVSSECHFRAHEYEPLGSAATLFPHEPHACTYLAGAESSRETSSV